MTKSCAYSQLTVRDLEMEYRVLMRINCHKAQYANLVKSSSSDFRRRNKYNEILPYLHNVVRVADESGDLIGEPEVKQTAAFNEKFKDYYNASFINTSVSQKAFIAAMAPTAVTVDTLWKLIYQHNVSLVVMLCPEEENNKEMCYNYYEPHAQGADTGKPFVFGGKTI